MSAHLDKVMRLSASHSGLAGRRSDGPQGLSCMTAAALARTHLAPNKRRSTRRQIGSS